MDAGGEARGKLTQGSEGGASASVSQRKARRGCGREQLENDAAVRELGAGGARARRGRSSGLAAREEKERKCGRERASARASAGEGGRVGAVSGRGCRAAGDAGAESPRGGIPLPRSRRGAATGARVRASGRKSRRAGLGWGAVGRRGRSVRRAGGRLAGPASAGGPEARRRPRKIEMEFFSIYFHEIFKCHLSNIILSKKMTSFENVPKMKVA